MTRILVIDNYDSFVYNLVQYLQQLGAETVVVRNDEVRVGDQGDDALPTVESFAADGILLSPGPGVPADAGVTPTIIRELAGTVPILGVCLGHQAMAEVFGGVVDRAEELLHGRTSQVTHDGMGVFAGLPSEITATRYHSLAVVDATVPEILEVTARTDNGVIMGLRHRELPLEGVQFHPESVLTQGGHQMLANFLAQCGDERALSLVQPLAADVERLRLSAAAVGNV